VNSLNLPTPKILSVVMFLLVLFALQGCGGGGGGSDNGPQNAAPRFTSGTTISYVDDGSTTTATGYTAVASDADGDTVTFSLSGGSGVDQTAFNIDVDSGVLNFNISPDFGTPGDSDGNNTYEVEIIATDGMASVMQRVTVTVIDDAEPTGYYINTGSASVSDGEGGTLDINDFQAIINGDRIMMMSVENELLYDGILTIIDNDFTASFTIYTGGENPISATASGMITQESMITGTLTGSGVGSGTFSLLYASTNNEVADIARIDNGFSGGVLFTWGATIGSGTADFEFIIEENGDVVDDVNNVQGLFHRCEIFPGSISPVAATNLYVVSATLLECADSAVDMNYTGFATTRNEPSTDETLVFMMTSDDYSFSSDFQ